MRWNAGCLALIAAAVAAGPLHAQAAGKVAGNEPPVCDPATAALAASSDGAGSHGAFAPAVLDALVGEWRGTGALFGSDARYFMRWEPSLDGRFLELRFEIEGPVSMESRAFYLLGAGDELRGTWIDTRGEFLDLAARATDSSLATEWTSSSETGRTVYRLVGPDAIEVCDFVRDDHGWRPFGTARYARGD